MSDVILYYSPQPTRSARARWAFLEAGVSFEGKIVDVFKGEHRSPEYLDVNPLGRVPAAKIDGEVMIESSALCLWAAEQHADDGLLPDAGTADYRSVLQWVVFAPAELDRLLGTLNSHTRFREPAKRNAELAAECIETLDKNLGRIAATLGEDDYLVGNRFSIADIAIGHALVWANMIGRLGGHTSLQSYVGRLQARPHFQAVYGPELPVFPDPHAAA